MQPIASPRLVHLKRALPISLMMLTYAIVFSAVTVTRFYALRTYAYDLGNYNQALYTTLKGYGFLYYTADLPVTGGSMMGVHFCPILLMILPIYALYPFPTTLLVLKSVVLACGALPAYWLGKHFLKTDYWGLLFAATYLLNPMLQGVNWFDFHPEAFFVTFFLFSLYYGLKPNWLGYITFSVLTLTTTEHAALLVLVESFFLLWLHQNDVIQSLKSLRHLEFRETSVWFRYPIGIMLVSLVWFFVALQIVSAFSPSNPLVKGGAPQWSILGADGIMSIPLQIIRAPLRALEALVYDWPLKIMYLAILFGSTMFLSFLSPKSLIITLPWLAVSLLSNYPAFYFTGNQYPVFLLPSLLVGSVLGTKRFIEYGSKRILPFDVQKVLASCLLISIVAFSVVSSPLYGFHVGNWPDLTYGIEFPSEHAKMVAKILTLVPPNASILTQNDIFPLVSSRTNSFVVPLGSFYPPGTSFDNTLNQWLQESDFVLVDFRTSLIESSLIFSYMKDFGVYASSDGIVLLKHSYLGSPLLFEPYSVELNSTQLVLKNGEIVPDADSVSRKVLAHFGNSTDIDPSGLFWRSRDVSLPPGEYEISFRMRVTNNLPSNIIDINCTGLPLLLTLSRQGTETGGYKVSFKTAISKNRSVYIWRDLKGENFSRNDTYELFKAKFSTDTTLFLQIGSQVISDSTDVFLDFIRISQTKPMP